MTFSSEWLALREPIDMAARSSTVLARAIALLEKADAPVITDLGTGTGSTLRAMVPHLSADVVWHLVDNDAGLLEIAAKEHNGTVETTLTDLSKTLDDAFARPATLVTTSAFLDLVSEGWLKGLVARLADLKAPFYAALSYDGRAGVLPAHDADETVLNAFNAHQTTDKGFGPALGPKAAEVAIQFFAEAGFKIESALSDWQAGPEHAAFQDMLLDGWRGAAMEIRPDLSNEVDGWMASRRAEIAAGRASVFVGHVDFLAIPPA